MSERRALLCVFATSMISVFLALFVLSLIGASSWLMGLAYLLILCVSADTGARVVLKYRR
jgi:hypothetical protein